MIKTLLPMIGILFVTGCAFFRQDAGNPNAIELRKNDMLLVTSPEGKALVEFTSFGDAQSNLSSYRWRFRSAAGTNETTGQGQVFEKYLEQAVSTGSSMLVDDGSQLIVRVGPISMEWSKSSPEKGWLYLDRTRMKATVLPNGQFATYHLGQ